VIGNCRSVVVALFSLAALLSTVPARVLGQEPEPMPAAPETDMAPRPELTLEQQRKMLDIELRYIRSNVELEADLAVKRLQLRKLWLAEKLDSKAILAKAKEIDAVRAKLAENRLKQRLEMLELLPPEQRSHFGMGMRKRPGPVCRALPRMHRMGRGLPGQHLMPMPGDYPDGPMPIPYQGSD